MYDSSTPGSAIGSPAGRGNDARRALALAGETFAAEHLQRLGYTIAARNHRTRFGELDIVAFDDQTLVFVEVKTQRASPDADPWRALHERKRSQVRRMAAAYLAEVEDRPRDRELRFDAIAVAIDARGRLVSVDHLEGAF
jgi:putative endonuclease